MICIKSKRNGRSHIGWIASIITMLSLTSVATLYLAFILPELLYGIDESRKGLSLAFSVLSLRAAGNVTLGICQRKVSARCFLLLRRHEGAVFRLLQSATPIQLLCVRKTHLDCFFPSLQCPHLLDTSKGTKGRDAFSICSSVPTLIYYCIELITGDWTQWKTFLTIVYCTSKR